MNLFFGTELVEINSDMSNTRMFLTSHHIYLGVGCICLKTNPDVKVKYQSNKCTRKSHHTP
jgi:hypothetical protein